MLKKILANRVAKKAVVFAAMFAITGVLMGSMLAPQNNVFREQAQLAQATAAEAEPVTAEETLADFMESTIQEAAVPLAAYTEVQRVPKSSYGKSFAYLSGIPMSYELQQYTFERCKELNLDYEWVLAIMWRESRFQVDAVNVNANGTKDSGIMQINDVNKDWLFHEHGIDNLMDPMQNIDAGTAMLAQFVEKYGEHDALMAYQYGETGMQKKIEQGIVTNANIALVMEKRQEFEELIR